MEIEVDDRPHLDREGGIGGPLPVLAAMRLEAARARMRCTVRALMAVTWPLSIRQLARSRPLHSVTPSSPKRSGVAQAAAITEHRSSAAMRRGRPGRSASRSPVTPSAAKRRDHLRTVAGRTKPAGDRPYRVAGVGEEDDAGSECGSLGGGGPASQTLQETARDIGQDERGRMHGEGAREGGRVPLSYGCSAPRREARMKIPESTKLSLQGKLVARQRERWPQLQDVRVRFRGNLAYVDGVLSDGDLLPPPPPLRGVGDILRLRRLPGQQRRLRRQLLAQRSLRGNPCRRLGLRLRPLPRRPHRLGEPLRPRPTRSPG